MSANLKKRILVVDDEPNIAAAVEFLMEQQGFEVRKAFNGEDALREVQSFQPGVVILDVMMPGMDGFEVARRIRQAPDLDHVRVIFLTAKGTESDRINGYASGGEVYLTKPFDNDDLVQIVQEVLA